MDLGNIGASTIKDSTAFKKIQFFSKTNPTNLFSVKSDFQNSLNKLNSFYLNDLDLNNSYTYGMDRQHTYTSLLTTLPMSATLVDNMSVNKFFSYNLNNNWSNNNTNALNLNRLDYGNLSKSKNFDEKTLTSYNQLLPGIYSSGTNNIDFAFFLKIPNMFNVLGAENDSKQYSNTFKFLLNYKYKKKLISNLSFMFDNDFGNESSSLQGINPYSTFSSSIFNSNNTLKFKNYKSSNSQFLGSERTVRLLTNLNSNLYKWNTSATPNLPTSLTNNLLNYGNSQKYMYSSSLSNWSDLDKHARFSNNIV
jgi:hypothetical protein